MTVRRHSFRTAQLAAAVSELSNLAKETGRTSFIERLGKSAEALGDTTVRVVVVGQFKQGKSALVNALVSAPVCPVDDLVATAIPTVVRWGETPSAAIITEFAETERVVRAEVDMDRLRQHVTELAGEAGLVGALRAEVALPRRILADGLTIIDTPGVGSGRARSSTNLLLLPHADAAIMVTDATQELTEPELAFLRQSVALCPRVSCVVSKTDLQHRWRDIVEADTDHLAAAGIEVPVLATSSFLHDAAVRSTDAALRGEAGIDALAHHLHSDIYAEVLHGRHRTLAEEILSVAEHLAMVLSAEREEIEGDSGPGGVQGLQQAEEAAVRLTERSARWHQTLSDGAGDLMSDIDFDLRDRLRAVGREAEQLIDSSDPAKAWQDIGTWLAESISQAVSDNFVWAHQRSMHLADSVARHFSLDRSAAVPELTLAGAQHALDAIGQVSLAPSGRLSFGQKFMIGMKGSYGGVLMFGLLTTLAGMALVNPISVAAGVIMGGFAYRQDATTRLEQRRGEAKAAVRKLIDESIFQVGKESRDRMNRVKRVLRDHFIDLAEDMKRSLNESILAAKESASLPADERARRAEDIDVQLRDIDQLCERVRTAVDMPAVSLVERRVA